MSLRVCPIQDICINYKVGGRKPPNNDVRNKVPCKSFLDFSCKLTITIQLEAMGLIIACDINKGRG